MNKAMVNMAAKAIDDIWEGVDRTHDAIVANRKRRADTNITGEKLIAEALHDLTDILVMLTMAQASSQVWERNLHDAKNEPDVPAPQPLIDHPDEQPKVQTPETAFTA